MRESRTKTSGIALRSILFTCALVSCSTREAAGPPSGNREPASSQETASEVASHYSRFLEARIVVPGGVFPPDEAEALLLPFMRDHADLFPGKRVLDIGSGTGIVALYAARLGAASVVATDIDPAAIGAIEENARRLHVDRVISARLVPETDMSAYSVLRPGEVFDLILSNPPYSLDLDAPRNTPLVDTGDLGFSIVRGLGERLSLDGAAVLLYNSLFYHRLMVKFARRLGHDVHHHDAYGLTPWELEALFNTSLQRVAEREGLGGGELAFDDEELPALRNMAAPTTPEPLLGKPGALYRGLIVIRPRTPPDVGDDGAGRDGAG